MTTNALKKQYAAKLSVVSNTILTILKLIAGIFTGSIGIVSEAIHSAIDLVASLMAYFAVKASAEPADDDHPYGHGKYEDISGFVEAILIFVAVIIILYEAITRLRNLGTVHLDLDLGIYVMAFATIANIIVSSYLFKIAKETDSIALQADAEHLRTDVYSSLGILLSLLAIKFTGMIWIDPVSAICIALFIAYIAYKLSRKAFNNLIDTALPEEEIQLIKEVTDEYDEIIVSIHKLRTRKSGSDRFIDFHIIIDGNQTVQQGHILCDCLEQDIKEKLPNTYVSIHLEPCTDDCDSCHVKVVDPDSCKKLRNKKNSN